MVNSARYDVEYYLDYRGIHFDDDMQTNLNTLEFVKGLTTKPIWLTETGKASATENNTETIQAEYINAVYSPFKPLANKYIHL